MTLANFTLRRFSFVSIFLILTNFSFCQSASVEHVDSLTTASYKLRRAQSKLSLQLAFAAKKEAEQLNYANGLSISFERIGSAHRYLNSFDSAIFYLNRGIQYDLENGLRENLPSKYNNLGLCFRRTQWFYDSSKTYYLKCIDASEKSKDLSSLSKCQNNLANLYKGLGFYEEALDMYLENVKLRESTSDSIGLVSTYNNLGNLFAEQKKFQKALSYYQHNLKIGTRLGDSLQLAKAFNNIGSILYDSISYDSVYTVKNFISSNLIETRASALAVSSRQLLDSASANFDYAARIYSKAASPSFKFRLAGTLNNKGNISLIKNEFDSAILLYTASIKLYQEINEKVKIGEALNNLGNAYRLSESFDFAMIQFLKASSIAKSSGNKRLETQISWNIAKTLRSQKKDRPAFNFLLDYHFGNDDMWNSERDRIIEDMEVKYQSQKKERQIELQQSEIRTRTIQRDNLTITLIVALSLTLVIIFLYQQRQRVVRQLRKKDKSIFDQRIDDLLQEQEIKSLSASLETQERERKRIAEDLHDRLGSMLSSVKLHYDSATSSNENQKKFKKAADILDETIRETRKIAYNLNSGVLAKFGLVPALEDLKGTIESTKKIEVELNVHNIDERLTNDLEVNIYRVIQEAVSNALKHSSASQITIQLTRHDDDHLTLMIADDGTGFDSKEKSMGMGLQNMEARMSKFEGEVTIDSRKGHGTTITVDIPNPQFLEQ